jgi:AcrR family transcriptional regulator
VAITADRTGHRERLLAAFADCIREKGLEQTQIADIVARARTSRRTFYECFADKDSCLIELIREANLRIGAQVLAAVDPSAPWEEQVDQAVDAYVDELARDPVLSGSASQVVPTLGIRARAVHCEAVDSFAELFVSELAAPERQAAGMPQLTLSTAIMLIGGVAELIGRANFLGEGFDEVAATAKAVTKAVLDPATQQHRRCRVSGGQRDEQRGGQRSRLGLGERHLALTVGEADDERHRRALAAGARPNDVDRDALAAVAAQLHAGASAALNTWAAAGARSGNDSSAITALTTSPRSPATSMTALSIETPARAATSSA